MTRLAEGNLPDIRPAGDAAVLVTFGRTIDPATLSRVRALDTALRARGLEGGLETVPGYATLTVQYSPERLTYADAERAIRCALRDTCDVPPAPARRVELPVLYGGDAGPDLPYVAEHAGITIDEAIRRHSALDYLVYMLGFTPGFPYLGGMDASLSAPRLDTPRVRIPAGSVGIAGGQTGVYPTASPGGWRLIGRTPVRLYDPAREAPILLEAGDIVRFRAISAAEYERLCEGGAAL